MEKYLEHSLSNSGTKADKVRRISLHALGANEGKQTDGEHAQPDDVSLNEAAGSTEGESDSEDDIALAELIERRDIISQNKEQL